MLDQFKKGSFQITIGFIGFSILFLAIPYFSISDWTSNLLVYSLIGTASIPILHAIILNNLIYDKDVIRKYNFVLAPVFVLFSGYFKVVTGFWVFSFFLLFFFNFLLNSYQKKYPFSAFFNSSFIIGLLSLFNSDLIFYLLLIVLVGLLFENLTWRSFAAIVFGFFTPIVFYCFLHFLFIDQNFFFPILVGFETPIVRIDLAFFSLDRALSLSVLFIVFSFSIIELARWLYKKSIKSRKSFIVLFFYILITLFIILKCNDSASWYLLLTPLSVIFTNYFVYSDKNKIINLLFLCLIISSIYFRVINIFL